MTFEKPTREDVRRIWNDARVRIFMSHRDTHRLGATRLALALRDRGMGVFVAHDTIRPTSHWHKEIEIALRTMDVLLAFVTDDFNESAWTNQEVGFAVGNGIEVIALKLDDARLSGFLERRQGLVGSVAEPEGLADDVCALVANIRKHRAEAAELIEQFVRAPSFRDALAVFARMQEGIADLNVEEFEVIREGFRSNQNLHASDVLRWKKNLPSFLERTVGRPVALDECEIRVLI